MTDITKIALTLTEPRFGIITQPPFCVARKVVERAKLGLDLSQGHFTSENRSNQRMKVFTPEISWHQKEPIFSVDFCPGTWKLASAGADFTIKVIFFSFCEVQHGYISVSKD